jgi:arsenical pump membrane protein
LTHVRLARRAVTPAPCCAPPTCPSCCSSWAWGSGQGGDRNGLGPALAPLLPGGASLPPLLATAALAAVLANACHNLPAVLVLRG